MLKPLYAALEVWPGTRAGAQRLGLVTIDQMVQALVQAVEQPPPAWTIRIMGVPEIRAARHP